jgi:hypothetical protein
MRVITIMKKNELHNYDNYKDELDVTVNDLVAAYSRIISDYYKNVSGAQYSKFVVLRGIDTVTNVFNHLIYYTRNLGLALSYSEKAYLFYIEFISQISDAEKLFLRLSSRDATMYVYNKTIADIKHVVNNANEETELKIKSFNVITNVIKTLIMKYYDEPTYNQHVVLILEHGITDNVVRLIDSAYYKTETTDNNKFFNEIVYWTLGNQSKINDKNNVYYEELKTLDNFISFVSVRNI